MRSPRQPGRAAFASRLLLGAVWLAGIACLVGVAAPAGAASTLATPAAAASGSPLVAPTAPAVTHGRDASTRPVQMSVAHARGAHAKSTVPSPELMLLPPISLRAAPQYSSAPYRERAADPRAEILGQRGCRGPPAAVVATAALTSRSG